jgi:hypothetical protein
MCSVELQPAEASVTRPSSTGSRSSQAESELPPDSADFSAGAKRWDKLPLASFVCAAVGTAVLGGLTIWSATKAVAARNLHETNPAAYDREETQQLARRTDLFLASTILLGAATTAMGLWWVDFGGAKGASVSILPNHGLSLVAEGRF